MQKSRKNRRKQPNKQGPQVPSEMAQFFQRLAGDHPQAIDRTLLDYGINVPESQLGNSRDLGFTTMCACAKFKKPFQKDLYDNIQDFCGYDGEGEPAEAPDATTFQAIIDDLFNLASGVGQIAGQYDPDKTAVTQTVAANAQLKAQEKTDKKKFLGLEIWIWILIGVAIAMAVLVYFTYRKKSA